MRKISESETVRVFMLLSEGTTGLDAGICAVCGHYLVSNKSDDTFACNPCGIAYYKEDVLEVTEDRVRAYVQQSKRL